MKRIDIKSFLIGVLVTTNIFFFMGFSSSNNSLERYDNDDLMKELKKVYGYVWDIDDELSKSSEYDFGTVRYVLRNIEDDVESIKDRLK